VPAAPAADVETVVAGGAVVRVLVAAGRAVADIAGVAAEDGGQVEALAEAAADEVGSEVRVEVAHGVAEIEGHKVAADEPVLDRAKGHVDGEAGGGAAHAAARAQRARGTSFP